MKNTRKKWSVFLILWIVGVFCVHYFYGAYLKTHVLAAAIVSFVRVTSGLFIGYKLLLEKYFKSN